MITEFALVNEYEQSYTLNDLRTGYFVAPSGMGYEIDSDYTQIGQAWVLNYHNDKQKTISGNIVFASSDPYREQTALLKFIRTSKRLKLRRKTSAGEYYKDVDIIKYDISRIQGRALKCPVSLASRSLWYANVKTTYQIIATSDKDYMKYPYKFPVRFSGSINGKIDISNDGSVPAPMQVSFAGPIVNPSLVLRQEGEEIARVDITGEAETGESIEYSSIDGDLYCYRLTASGEQQNLTREFNLENDNFFKIPIGASELEVSADADIVSPITFNVRRLYRAV